MRIAPQNRAQVKLACLEMLVGLKLVPAGVQLISGFVDVSNLKVEMRERQI
jgi:hypothetical protein